jgi:hypothetical protein
MMEVCDVSQSTESEVVQIDSTFFLRFGPTSWFEWDNEINGWLTCPILEQKLEEGYQEYFNQEYANDEG